MPRITLLRAALQVKCPWCGALISWRTAAPHVQFLCPKCGHGVHLRDSYFRVLYILSLLVIGFLAYALGARGDVLFWAVILGVLPTNFVVVFLTMRLFPPDAESTGEFRGILYSDRSASEDEKNR